MPTSRAVVTEDDIEVMTGGEDLGMYRAHRRYGGFDAGAALAGLLAATGMTALLGGIASAIGTIGYQLDTGASTDTISTGGFIAGLVVLLLSFLVGGWVAGRVARYEGGLNGLVAAGLFIVLSAIMAGMGAWFGDRYDIFADIRLPQWFSNTSSATAILSAVVALVVMVAAGWFGGVLGSRYHRRVDTYLAEYAQGGRKVTAGRSSTTPAAASATCSHTDRPVSPSARAGHQCVLDEVGQHPLADLGRMDVVTGQLAEGKAGGISPPHRAPPVGQADAAVPPGGGLEHRRLMASARPL